MPANPVERGSALTAWGQVLRDLRRRLDSGELPPGARLPAESLLAEQCGASRVTVRRAIAELAAQGRVVTRPGSGTYAGARRDARVRLDLSLPWREQVLGAGREARTEALPAPPLLLPPSLAALLGAAPTVGLLDAGSGLHLVDGLPIGLTEAWTPFRPAASAVGSDARLVEHGVLDLDTASRGQAAVLQVPSATPLIVVAARSSLAATGEAVAFSRTWWVASRVRLVQSRALSAASSDLPRG
ncbi:hypothetical protein ASF48_00865 [Rathayibacter sp. Leaf299]|uniref:GntR family transcriptional regulator n=1 Tax=Rathayibacter sp. Leaf299 TaxID=1736328 RepID=UPI0006F4C160|nr:GntR family transcriptional regulator [Rathayibacter sp. Leaf299]KQQ21837.1 hypothetical protein ASF48_00865 [Rathayibacter sp. Leaf299]